MRIKRVNAGNQILYIAVSTSKRARLAPLQRHFVSCEMSLQSDSSRHLMFRLL